MGVLKLKDVAHGILTDSRHSIPETQIHLTDQLIDDEHQSCQQDNGLQTIAPHDGLDAAVARVESNENQDDESVEPEGNVIRVENQVLQNDADKIQTDTGTQQLAQEEEGGSRLVG